MNKKTFLKSKKSVMWKQTMNKMPKRFSSYVFSFVYIKWFYFYNQILSKTYFFLYINVDFLYAVCLSISQILFFLNNFSFLLNQRLNLYIISDHNWACVCVTVCVCGLKINKFGTALPTTKLIGFI